MAKKSELRAQIARLQKRLEFAEGLLFNYQMASGEVLKTVLVPDGFVAVFDIDNSIRYVVPEDKVPA